VILVLVEPEGAGPEGSGVSSLALEALTFARQLAGADGDVQAVVVGDHPASVLDDLKAFGVTKVHHATGDRLGSYAAPAWAAAVAHAVAEHAPTAVLGSGSPRGTEVLAHLAARLELPLAANCVAALTDPASGPLIVHRQVMGGSALEEVEVSARPALLTLAGHVLEPQPASVPTTPQVVTFTPQISDADLVGRVRRVEATASSGSDLATSRVVIGAGRGVGGADRFGDLQELVQRLGGALGVSRVVTSLGWRPHHEQVGQTGSRITPDVYIACGISGAIQHWAGCSSAKTIIAINTDAEAPMVTKAHYAVIGDLHEVVPAINAELAARRTG
jgi:electron transfer flavoprotein alpha subunit